MNFKTASFIKPIDNATVVGGILLAGMLLANGAYASDSAKLYWDVNGHYYQRFETGGIIWSDAKKACESKSGHLATITSQEEQGFIKQFLTPSSPDHGYHIGATDTASQTNFKWITGEPWSYENWYPGYPQNKNGQDYLAITDYKYNNGLGKWFDVFADTSLTGYICEWSAQNYIGTALVPDLNGNGADEIAGLFVDYKTGKHTVQIKDPMTDKLINTLTFATNFNPPLGLMVVEDINGNGIPEIGVLFVRAGYPNVQIKDAQDNAVVLKSIDFLSASYRPRAINSSPDANGNGTSEIVVMGVHKQTGKAAAEIRDSKTGDKSRDTPF